MRIDAYNQVAQLYGVQSNYKTQKTSSVSAPKDQVSISQECSITSFGYQGRQSCTA